MGVTRFIAIALVLQMASNPNGKSNFLQVFFIPAVKKNDVIFLFLVMVLKCIGLYVFGGRDRRFHIYIGLSLEVNNLFPERSTATKVELYF
ncbi:hypothetical protein GCM10007422_11340 [Pedobacter zeae]|uniref:Uncharacterized protein n=1 Tax=Pedobacter zeae TaxID=1737356 RepID=A0ABQ1XP77_9SPHI|nr:hypothetical protein GCM10007422_11340 [Pedobacter zeae]